MSIRVMTDVWEASPLKGSQLLLLLALADHCNEERYCWPSIDSLAHKCRLSRRQTEKLLSALAAHGHITVETGSDIHRTNTYRLPPREEMAQLKPLPPQSEWDNQSTPSPTTGTQTRRPRRVDPVAHDGGPPSPTTDQPSSNRQRTVKPPGAHPALLAYVDGARKMPPKSWYEEIADTVGTDPRSLDRWRELVRDWVGRGWNKGNVKGMLDKFRQEEPGVVRIPAQRVVSVHTGGQV